MQRLKQLKILPRLALLVLLAMPMLCWAQVDDEPVTQLLKGFMPEHCAISGLFEQQKKLPGLPIPIESQGDFFFYCELGVIWRTAEPFEDALIYTPYNRYFRVNDASKVTSLNGVIHHNIAKILLAILSGDEEFFMDKFSIMKTGAESAIWLLPKSQWLKKGIDKITLGKSKKNNIVQLAIYSASSEVTLLSIFDVENSDVSTKSIAFDTCVVSIASKQACEVLRYPGRFDVQ